MRHPKSRGEPGTETSSGIRGLREEQFVAIIASLIKFAEWRLFG